MKAYLFDFNGTLFNDTHLHIAAWRSYLKRKFGMDLTEEYVRKHFMGPSNEYILRELLGYHDATKEWIDEIGVEKEEEYRTVAISDKANLRLVNGAVEMLDTIKSRGIPMALATASIYENIVFYLEDLGMNRWFDIRDIVYVDGKLACKPDPAFYLEAARRVHTPPEECTIVEDSKAGLQAAKNANAGRIIAIANTLPEAELLTDKDLYAVIRDFNDFERFL